MADRHDIPDDFWDLSSLLPKKRPPVMRERKPDIETVTIEFGAPEEGGEHGIGSLSVRFREVEKKEKDSAGKRGFDISVQLKLDVPEKKTPGTDAKPVTVPSGTKETRSDDSLKLPPRESLRAPQAEVIDEYEPEGGLIRRVRVMRWASKYSFYEQFRHDAKRYADVEGEECPPVDFFSYTPQYRQMSRAQLAYYFWWRSRAKCGEWLPASFSYILLYIYETINLHELIPPEEGLRRLVGVWLAYRDKHKVLDKYLSEWVADYCLIHRLPAPREELSPIMTTVMETASFREFYMAGGDGGITTETLIELSSDYNFHKSKFALDDETVRGQYVRHIPAAVEYVAKRSGDGKFSTQGMKSAVVSRDAFCGSLCAHNVKCRIDIEYLSYTRSRELRSLMTELVKYCENRLRAALGIRSRLRVSELDESYRVLADEYFEREFPASVRAPKMSREERLAAEERQYDAAYDALSHGVDAAGAAEIERASWASTELLAPEFAEGTVPDEGAEPGIVSEIKTAESTDDGSIYERLDGEAAEYLRLQTSEGKEAARQFCRERSLYEDEIAARVNEAASEIIGDIILEPDGPGGYAVIEDYVDEIR